MWLAYGVCGGECENARLKGESLVNHIVELGL